MNNSESINKFPVDEFLNAHGHGKEKLLKWWHKAKKYNPALAMARAGFILILRKLNLFGISTRLLPALLDDAQIKKYGIKPSSVPSAKKGLEKVKSLYEKVGGEPSVVEKAVRKGGLRKATKHLSRHSSADGQEQYSGVIAESTIAAGMALAAAALKMLSSAGVDKNPFESGGHGLDDMPPAPDVDTAHLDKLKALADEDKAKGLGLDSSDGSNNTWLYVGIGAAVLLTAGIIYFSFKGKK